MRPEFTYICRVRFKVEVRVYLFKLDGVVCVELRCCFKVRIFDEEHGAYHAQVYERAAQTVEEGRSWVDIVFF